MEFHTPPQNQGQIIEVSYGYDGDGDVVRRVRDHSDRTEQVVRVDPWDADYSAAQAAELDSWSPWNAPPPGWVEDLLDEAAEVEEAVALAAQLDEEAAAAE